MRREDVTTSVRLAGQVERYHTWPTISRQTVGEHTWQVMRIHTEIFGMPTIEAWFYILHHDTPEVALGDPPFPVKANSPELKAQYDIMERGAYSDMGIVVPELSDWQRRVIKICDLLEMWEFGRYEIMLGNQHAVPIIKNTLEAATKMASMLHKTDQKALSDWIGTRGEEYVN